MTSDRDDASLRGYRAASETLDERPSAATRAAILAAAARQVDARPQSADAPPVQRRRGWPVAAAAAVLLSTLAVMMATRTEQEMPTFTDAAPRTQEKAVAAPPVASSRFNEAVPAAEAPQSPPPVGAASPAQPAARAPAPSAPAERPLADSQAGLREKKVAPVPAAEERARARAPMDTPSSQSNAMQAPAAPQAPAASSELRQEAGAAAGAVQSAPPPAAPPPPAPARAAKAPAALAAPSAPSVASDAAKEERALAADRAARSDVAPSAALPAAPTIDAAREFERSPRQWIDHIVQLRSAGRQAEADAELKRFRERYPQEPVPPAALPSNAAAGTR